MYVCMYVRHAQKIAKLFFGVRRVPFQIKYIIQKKIYQPLEPQNTPFLINILKTRRSKYFPLFVCAITLFSRFVSWPFRELSISRSSWPADSGPQRINIGGARGGRYREYIYIYIYFIFLISPPSRRSSGPFVKRRARPKLGAPPLG